MTRTKRALTAALVKALVGISGTLVPGIARAQNGDESTLPDSSFEALKGRQVTVTTKSGLSASGELAGFDAKTVTLIKADSKLAIIERKDVTEMVVATPDPAPAPAQPAPATEAPAPAPAPAETTDQTSKKKKRKKKKLNLSRGEDGVHSAGPLDPAQHLFHEWSGAGRDYCKSGVSDPTCLRVLRKGAKKYRRRGGELVTQGIVTLIIGTVGVPVGAWLLTVGIAEEDGLDACVAAGLTSCHEDWDPVPALGGGGGLVVVGGICFLFGIIALPMGISRMGAADQFLLEHRVSLAPVVSDQYQGLTVSASF